MTITALNDVVTYKSGRGDNDTKRPAELVVVVNPDGTPLSGATSLDRVAGVDGATVATVANPFPTKPVTNGYSAALTITRPANATPYTALDNIGGALTFANMGAGAGEILITSVALEIDVTAVPAGMANMRLYLYNVTPPSATADNGAWDLVAGDRASFLGYVDLGTPVDLGSTLYVKSDIVNCQIKLASSSLFGYLVTIGGFTPAGNSEVYVCTLHAIAL